jgi:hypothetical protein
MTVGAIIALVLSVGLFCTMAVVKLRQPPLPSRFRQALWAESVRKRGLSTEEAMKEYKLLWPDRPASRLVPSAASAGLCPACLHTAHGDLLECKACYCRS